MANKEDFSITLNTILKWIGGVTGTLCIIGIVWLISEVSNMAVLDQRIVELEKQVGKLWIVKVNK